MLSSFSGIVALVVCAIVWREHLPSLSSALWAALAGELGPGNLFATGLIAGGALTGVLVAVLVASSDKFAGLKSVLDGLNLEEKLTHALGQGGFELLGVAAFVAMGAILFKVALKPTPKLD